MAEYNIFCWSTNYNDENSFQQARYRVFNKVVTIARYAEVMDVILSLRNSSKTLHEYWGSLTPEQIQSIVDLPEFDKEGFEYITELKVPEKDTFSGKRVEVKIGNNTYFATID